MFCYLVRSTKQHTVRYPKMVMLSRGVVHRYGFQDEEVRLLQIAVLMFFDVYVLNLLISAGFRFKN